MRIVYIADHIYLHGGIEKVLTEKANYFADVLNYEVYILTTQQEGNPSCYLLSDKVNLIDLGIPYDRSKSFFHISNLKNIHRHFHKQSKFLKSIHPDFVIAVNYTFDFYWLPFINRTSKKVKEYHGSQYRRQELAPTLKVKLFNRLKNFIERLYDAIVVLNPDEQMFFKSANTFVIPNPIDIPNLRAELNRKQVLAAGRIAPVKGFERLLEIWSLVLKEHPDWDLHIYGEPFLDTQIKLEAQIKQLGIEENVSFKGSTNSMTDVMMHYSLYLMTSHTECLPMVLLESLSVGLPIVAFDVPTGPRNIVTNNNDGILIENNDIDGFAKSVNYLISDDRKRKRMGIAAKENSLIFANINIMTKWSELFYKLNK